MNQQEMKVPDASAALSGLVLMSGRRFADSSEMVLLVHTRLQEFWLALGNRRAGSDAVGYLHFVRVADGGEIITGQIAGKFELQQVLPASSPAPHPVISWSGVLWTRRAAREADAAIQSFLQPEDLNPQDVPQSDLGSSHREA